MNKFFKRLRLLWFFTKALFGGVQLEGIDTSGEEAPHEVSKPTDWSKHTVKRFAELYNVNAEDKIDYTNTHEHHHSNFKHKDEFNEELQEVAGLVYEEDGKTPKNAAEVFDMTYEEYEAYKEKILPQSKDRTISYEEVKKFIEIERE